MIYYGNSIYKYLNKLIEMIKLVKFIIDGWNLILMKSIGINLLIFNKNKKKMFNIYINSIYN